MHQLSHVLHEVTAIRQAVSMCHRPYEEPAALADYCVRLCRCVEALTMELREMGQATGWPLGERVPIETAAARPCVSKRKRKRRVKC